MPANNKNRKQMIQHPSVYRPLGILGKSGATCSLNNLGDAQGLTHTLAIILTLVYTVHVCTQHVQIQYIIARERWKSHGNRVVEKHYCHWTRRRMETNPWKCHPKTPRIHRQRNKKTAKKTLPTQCLHDCLHVRVIVILVVYFYCGFHYA